MSGTILSPADADLRLPFVAAVAAEAVAAAARLAAAEAEFRAERARPLPAQALLNDLRREIRALTEDLARCRDEAASAGGALADPATGTVDFASSLDGAPVALCWRAGEARVEHWHGRGDDHGTRRPLPVPVHAG